MRLARNQSMSAWLTCALAAGLPLAAPAAAQAEPWSAAASGGVAIVEPVGASVAYNVVTQVLSAIFLSGRESEKISLVRPGREGNAASGSAVNRPVDAGSESFVVLASGTVSVNVGSFGGQSADGSRNGDDGTVVVLAQFN